MDCPSCGYDNPEAARFCGDCGAERSATTACPARGGEHPRGQKFCNECGHRLAGEPAPAKPEPPAHLADKITASAASLEGERKQVTVLFADVQGSMDLAESVDTEEWR